MRLFFQCACVKCHRLSIAVLLMLGVTLSLQIRNLQAQTPVQFMRGAKLGLFVHYVYGLTHAAPGKPPHKSLKKFANDLDVNAIAKLADQMDAQYVILTAWHWRMTTLFPSKVWGKLFPHHVCQRDIIGQLATALKARGIKFVLYVHPDDRHDFTTAMIAQLVKHGYTSARFVHNGLLPGEPHDPKWDRLYCKMLKEVGQRYGREIYGYWEDDGGGGTNGLAVQKIMEHYTPGAAIWLNGFTKRPPATLVGGEAWNLIDYNPRPHIYNTSPAQTADVISSNWWAAGGKVKFTAQQLYRFFICSIATKGQHNGGVVYATGIYSDNQWETGVPQVAMAFGKLVRANAKAIFNTVPSHAYISHPKAAEKPQWGVAVDSPHRHTVYLHVLMPPKGNALHIGKPADGVTFITAALLNGHAVGLEPTAHGYALTLPDGMRWNRLDTIIALKEK